ncbi:MAG: hypothetical protein K0S61_3326 [Anaerocolumna sp.]|jgi:hypothetical protein|nr:hypothetical protein [Anaerocolumna sp.]
MFAKIFDAIKFVLIQDKINKLIHYVIDYNSINTSYKLGRKTLSN